LSWWPTAQSAGQFADLASADRGTRARTRRGSKHRLLCVGTTGHARASERFFSSTRTHGRFPGSGDAFKEAR
jgi:hypothetical protein